MAAVTAWIAVWAESAGRVGERRNELDRLAPIPVIEVSLILSPKAVIHGNLPQGQGRAMRTILVGFLLCLGLLLPERSSAQSRLLSDNADSIAVVVGNKTYKQTSSVDFAHNDAEAIKAWLIGALGFREQNIFLLKDATLSELNQVFGTEVNPQSGRLWRSTAEGRSNVFVYYSGHGVPDLATRQPMLLPQDGNPNLIETGYALQTLYRNLELVRQKIGSQRQLIVMVDACFTGETGRKGESLLAVSAPGFVPAKPRAGSGIVKLVATSGTTPANWDENQKLGLFTSRFLMGAAGLARQEGASEDSPLAWSDLQRYLLQTVEVAARRDSGREQAPEIDQASLTLPVALPVPAVARAVALARDEANWQQAKATGERSALEAYVARCGEVCQYRATAMAQLLNRHRGAESAADERNWQTLSTAGKYEEYLRSCGTVCAYRAVALGYLGRTEESAGAPTVPHPKGQVVALPPASPAPADEPKPSVAPPNKPAAQTKTPSPPKCKKGETLTGSRCIAARRTEKVRSARPVAPSAPDSGGSNTQSFQNSSGDHVVVRARTVRTYVNAQGHRIRVVERTVTRNGRPAGTDQVEVNLHTNEANGI
ncbi:hypothetical protein ASE66_12460 [Bosea sp. Root483D1]|uniref:caspase family protein n=1 Tax=Bosea sp. Root483D1 TaxID=1736544 RepID=UPI00070AB09F|nr:caspase family protein [Bosea sp. Root483D1]KRE15651.1 hypothetical protein ASE66_12460 [Bosea sp. Root483D1]